MKKLDYKLFFYTGEKSLSDNIKDINLNPSQENIEINNKISNNEKQRNFSNKAKQQYNFHLKRNKNIILFKKKSTPGKITSKDYSENKENLEKEDKNDGLSLLSFIPKKKEIYKNKNLEEFKKLQRNKVTKRRIEYSKRVKNIEANKNRYRNNTKKIITIQKWVRGFIIRNLISNLNCFEDFRNEVLDHLKKFVFLKLKIDIIFDNENTSIDYINKKGKFINDNNEEDQDCEIKEEIKIKEMNKYNMIKIYDDDSILVNFYIFILLTLLSFVEFYKIYLNYISIYEEFTIRKVISLINDLSQSQEYNKYNPDVKIMGRKFINFIVSLNNDSRNKKNENKGNYKTNNDNVNNDNANNNKINTDSETRRKANVDSDSKNPYIKNN
jgi:hypothetical protein